MRVAIGAMKHESNTFTDRTTGVDAFQPVQGADIHDRDDWEESASLGIIDELEGRGHEAVLTQFAHALPDGIVEREAHDTLHDGIVEGIEASRSIDAVCLDLHGSMYAADDSDPEGTLLAAVRDQVGPDVPIVSSLDMHATVTERMVEFADGFTAYRTAPHTDVYETGVRAAELLCEIASGIDPVMERIRLPMLLAGEQSETDSQPMQGLIERLGEAETAQGILSTAYLLGFPWADSPHNGVYAIVVGEQSAEEAVENSCRKLAEAFWSKHEEFGFTTPAYDFDTALDVAADASQHPVIIADTGDNPTAGAVEQSSFVVERLIDRGSEDVLVAVIADAATVADARDIGTGGTFECDLGYTSPVKRLDPLRSSVNVLSVGSADGLKSTVLDVQDVTVIVTAERTAVYDPAFLAELDVDPCDYSTVVVKSGYLSPEYREIAAESLLGLTPGETDERLESLPYKRVPRPIYPIDENVGWDAGQDP